MSLNMLLSWVIWLAGDLAKRGWQVKVDVLSLKYHDFEFCQGSNFFTTEFLICCRQLSKERLLQI